MPAAFRYISKKRREEMPDEDFGDPKKKLYPIENQEDLDSAVDLIGKHPELKSRIKGIAKRKGLKLPKAWEENETQKKVTNSEGLPDGVIDETAGVKRVRAKMIYDFTAAPSRTENGFAIYDNAMLFEAGDYPDKGFTMSPEELASAIDDFKPIAGNLDHTQWLAGEACFVDNAWIDPEDPWKVRGTVRVPQWLDGALKDEQKKLSAEWDPDTRRLSGIALCTNPRIKDAALVAAFAKFAETEHRTPHGQYTIQRIHNFAAEAGAVCDPDEDDKDAQFSLRKTVSRLVGFISHPERRGLQKIHNAAVKHGARCNNATSYFTRERLMNPVFKKIHDALFTKGADGKSPSDDPEVKAFLTALETEEPTLKPPAETAAATTTATDSKNQTPANFADSPEAKAMQNRIDQLEAKQLDTDAAAWADDMIKVQKRALPPERDSLIAQFKQAASDDKAMAGKAVTFSDGKSRLDFLKATVAARPPHVLYSELLPDAIPEGSVAVFNKETADRNAQKAPDPKELAELRKHSQILSEVDREKARAGK